MAIPIYYDPMIAKLATLAGTVPKRLPICCRPLKIIRLKDCQPPCLSEHSFLNMKLLSVAIRYTFCKELLYAWKIKEKQKNNAEIAALVALKITLDSQEILKPVDNKSTSWKTQALSFSLVNLHGCFTQNIYTYEIESWNIKGKDRTR